MARFGVWQLKKLEVQFCGWGGSSKGVREFIKDTLPAFQQNNPQLEVITTQKKRKASITKRVLCYRRTNNKR